MTPFLVAIAGGSGSGKSVLTHAVAAALGAERVATLAHDRYYRDRKDLLPIERSRLNYDVPDALDQALFREHLMGRRISRDTIERGRTPDAVVAQCRSTVFPAHSRYVEPSRALADLVLLNAGRLEPVVEVATAVIRSELARRHGGSGIANAA